ncbi:MAG: hypothetical protein ACFCUN_00450 [Hyphomicrobiaceae bacterium]
MTTISASRPRSRVTLGYCHALTLGVLAAVTLAGTVGAADAVDIHTGGETGAYHSHFCPSLVSLLAKRGASATCRTSAGTEENMSRVAAAPEALGFAQLDVFALSARKFGGASAFTTVRVGDARECVFAVTKSPDITSFGEVSVFASQLAFFLPPEGSGSAGTFRYLQDIDAEGLGQAIEVETLDSTDAAIKKALETPGGVAFFVQFADPANPRFKLIQDLGGHIVPIIDRTILAQTVEGQRVYFAQETQVTNSRWLKAGEMVTTACTPMVVFSGHPDRIADSRARDTHRALLDSIEAAKVEDVMPKDGLFTRMLRRSREISASSAQRLEQLAEEARTRAAPMMERARETGQRLYERAKEGTQTMIERAAPPPAKQ